MSKLISFSLWGDNPKYLHGAIQNAKQRADYYHDWVCKFFVHKDVPKETVQTLREQEGTIVSILEGDADWTFALTRFLPFADDDVVVLQHRTAQGPLDQVVLVAASGDPERQRGQ